MYPKSYGFLAFTTPLPVVPCPHYYIISDYLMLYHIVQYNIMLYHMIWNYMKVHDVLSYYIISYHILFYHTIVYCDISYNFISYCSASQQLPLHFLLEQPSDAWRSWGSLHPSARALRDPRGRYQHLSGAAKTDTWQGLATKCYSMLFVRIGSNHRISASFLVLL